MKIIDISVPITKDGVCYPGNKPVGITKQYDMDSGDAWNVTDISMSTHTATHVDGAKHHYNNQPGVEGIPMTGLVGRAYVVDVYRSGRVVEKEDLAYLAELQDFDILLLKTKNTYSDKAWKEFDEDHAYIGDSAAEWIVENGIKGVGIDCLSVEKYKAEKVSAHKILLKDNKVAVIEGVDLRDVMPGFYFCACLPINIVGSDGAPARAVLIPEEEMTGDKSRIGVRRDGSYYTRIHWTSHTTDIPYTWVMNLIDDDIERFGGTWGANTNGPANVILDFFGEKQEIGMFRVFHNVGIDISILEEMAKQIRFYVSDDHKAKRLMENEAIDSVEWELVTETTFEMKEKWTDIVLKKPVKGLYLRMELVGNFGTPPHLPWVETSELKIYPPR